MVRAAWKTKAIWAGALLALALIVAPFLWIVGISLKFQIAIFMGQFQFDPTLVNYDRVLFGKSSDFLLNLRNSLVVAVVSTGSVLVVGTLAAYSLAWRKWSALFSSIFLAWTLIFNIVPPITLVGPWYLIFREVGLFNTLTGLNEDR